MPAFDPERAAQILMDALTMGDKGAAEKWNVTERTVANHRARVESDPRFAAFFRTRSDAQSKEWRTIRLRFLRKSIAKLEALVEMANSPEQISDVADAVKIIGELQIASDALSVDAVDQPSPGLAADGEGDTSPDSVH